MLIEVHHGDGRVLLVNGNCQPIHLLNYIRNNCSLSSSIKLDLCLINSGEPFHLSSNDSKVLSQEKRRFPFHVHCVLTQIDDEGTYIPLLNDPTLITNEFLTKLKRATTIKPNPSKILSKGGKQSNQFSNKDVKRPRSLRALVIAATVIRKSPR